ncbi:hypothetical protein C8R46DRAFT_1296065, partial [Mycena filopes]
MYEALMNSRESASDALDSLWGPVHAESASSYIYVEGVGSKTTAAGAGIVFGRSSSLDSSLVVPGPNFGTAERARIFAIREALLKVSPHTQLVIFCTSKAIIRQLCYNAAKNSTLGWPGANADIFKDTIKLLSSRHARTSFVYVDANSGNKSQREAWNLAK